MSNSNSCNTANNAVYSDSNSVGNIANDNISNNNINNNSNIAIFYRCT